MKFIVVTFDTSHFEMSPLNDEEPRNMALMSITLGTSHFEMSPLNEVAPANIALIVFTLDTSHFEMSALKDLALFKVLASSNILSMSVTRDTSHSPIGPCGPLGQSPFGDKFRHVRTALLSSALDCGEKAGGWGRVGWVGF